MKISIAMATFNGEKYLHAQFQSLLGQTRLPDEVVISDDGSTDGTFEVLEEFRKRAPFPVRIHRNEINLGYARNFLTTAQRCRGDWVAFCDQDDVWLPNKLADAVCAVEQTPHCCMVLQNAWLCDGALVSSKRTFPNSLRPGLYGPGEQYGFWVWPGFLQTIDRRIFELWDGGTLPRNYFPKYYEISHDKWTCMVANSIGYTMVLDEPSALFRRHDAAITGKYSQKTFAERAVKARSVSADHYDFLAEVAADYARYMSRLSACTENPKWVSALRDHSRDFLKLQRIQRLRAELYDSRRLIDRLVPFISILREGGYFGTPFTAMGARSLAKDTIHVLFGP